MKVLVLVALLGLAGASVTERVEAIPDVPEFNTGDRFFINSPKFLKKRLQKRNLFFFMFGFPVEFMLMKCLPSNADGRDFRRLS